MSDVSCSDCHNIHAGHNLKVKPAEMTDLCYKCHQTCRRHSGFRTTIRSRRRRSSARTATTPMRHVDKEPPEGHGEETCTQCHAEKEGPFLYEARGHDRGLPGRAIRPRVRQPAPAAGARAVSSACSAIRRIRLDGSTTAQTKQNFYNRCTDCHSQMHGTDLPSPSGKGTFVR